jgi:hypothetical protein
MDIPNEAKRVRAVLSKQGEPDIRFELHRISALDFSIVENGKNLGVCWRTLSKPPGLQETTFAISQAFEDCVGKKYPGYTVKQVEYALD